MALTSFQSASPTIGVTEYSLADASTTLPTKTDDGIYVIVLDTNAVLAADSFLVQCYEMAVVAGTKRVAQSWIIEGPQGTPVIFIPGPDGLMLGNGWDLTIKKLAGTDRAIPFTVWRVV